MKKQARSAILLGSINKVDLHTIRNIITILYNINIYGTVSYSPLKHGKYKSNRSLRVKTSLKQKSEK